MAIDCLRRNDFGNLQTRKPGARDLHTLAHMPPFAFRTALTTLLLASSTAACSAPAGQAQSQQVEAQAEHLSLKGSRFHWIDVDEDGFNRLSVRAPFPTGAAVDAEHAAAPLHHRITRWLTAIDIQARARYRAKHGSELPAPPPQLRIVPALSPNAWVAGIPVCLDAPLRINTGSAERPASEGHQAILLPDKVQDGQLGYFGGAPQRCGTASWSGEVADFVEFFNAQGGACQLQLDDGVLTVSGERCSYAGRHTEARRTVVYATTPFISFTSEMFVVSPSESAIVSTLAHELGHYYQAHATTAFISGRYDYWYQQEETPSAKHPAPLEDSAEIAARVESLFPYPIPEVAGQHYSPRLTGFLLERLGQDLLRDACGEECACSPALATLDHTWTNELNCLGCRQVSEQAESRYLAFEEALRECAPDVTVSSQPGPGEISLEALRERLSWEALASIEPTNYPATMRLSELLGQLNEGASKLDDDKQTLLDEIDGRHLGRYTLEQEADDFSIEYFARVGNDPLERLEAQLGLTRYRSAEDPRAFVAHGGISFADCERQYEAQWMSEGAYSFIPLGATHDTHHGMCYRLFNMSRELTAHGYQAGPEQVASWDLQWSAAQQSARDLRGEVPPPRPGGMFSLRPATSGAPIIIEGF